MPAHIQVVVPVAQIEMTFIETLSDTIDRFLVFGCTCRLRTRAVWENVDKLELFIGVFILIFPDIFQVEFKIFPSDFIQI